MGYQTEHSLRSIPRRNVDQMGLAGWPVLL
jgi:hypothetical protein